MFKSTFFSLPVLTAGLLLSSFSVYSDDGDNSVVNRAFDFFTDSANGWTEFANDDSHIGPGGGGQRYDAEYLFYKYDDTTNNLSIGLQTGFDVNDGSYSTHYAGDLALSFDDSTSGPLNGYEYAVDFGLLTKDIDQVEVDTGSGTGIDTAGLYSVSAWNNNILNSESSPFAMDEGSLIIGSLSENTSNGYGSLYTGKTYGFTDGVNNAGIDSSFYRVVTFNLAGIVNASDGLTVDAHWTMSCGNDAINGHIAVAGDIPGVPEPSVLALFGVGSLSIVVTGLRRRKIKK